MNDVVDYFMSVHIDKYRLQWIYVRNVSSGINVRFCAYCAHLPGIDTPSQKMHDAEVIKLDMWLVVEEMWAHEAMMAWVMVFGVIVPKVGDSGDAVNIEVALAGGIPDPLEAHVNRFRLFLLDGIVCKYHRCGVIYLHGGGDLGMSKFFKGCADW